MHKLLNGKPESKHFLLGNEAIARGAIEAGVKFATTYPGTPSSEISGNLFQISQETSLYFEYSGNEKIALELASAAANSNLRSLCLMKHVGVNVASDVLMTLAYLGVRKGLVLLTADDPAMFSSQNEQDNRYYGKLAGLPVLEPSSAEEAKEMISYAFDLSEQLNEPVIFRTTTRINHSSGEVKFSKIKETSPQGEFIKDPMNLVSVPAISRRKHKVLLDNLEKAAAIAETCPYNFIEGNGELGIICNGVSYAYVMDAINELNITDKTKILRLGFSHPMPDNLLEKFLNQCSKVLVVEEGEPVMEEYIRSCAQSAGIIIEIKGKDKDLFSRLYEYNTSIVRDVIAKYFDINFKASKPVDISDIPTLPNRPPNLCAGCSHRATFYAVKQTGGTDTIYPSDIGCYTLGFLPPLAMGDFVVCMGASIGTACGFSKSTGKKVVAFIGDSTFFHSGINGLISAVFNNHDITLIILDNRTTAMTGHQPNPGVDMTELGFEAYNKIDIETIVKSLGVQCVKTVKPYNVKKTKQAVKEAMDFKGVSVVIAKEKCVLYAKQLKQNKKTVFQVNEAKCKNHRNCVNDLGCPAFFIENEKVKINSTMCTGCSVCAQICPEHAISPVKIK
ncbi:MAG: indolepyruvate ferredoxin oxidoreductase subunit alpha [Deltaproteobacteria bacterium]|nr:MAG: indolepyruvate ferredoxin oxidoreductase subunit alpha [Deltaproteobacteria bacterium]